MRDWLGPIPGNNSLNHPTVTIYGTVFLLT